MRVFRAMPASIWSTFSKGLPVHRQDGILQAPNSKKLLRITQESLADGPTADVMFNNAATIRKYVKNEFVRSID
jgi:hypothetical protein